MSDEQRAHEAIAMLAMAQQATDAFNRRLTGGKRQRCVCGALEDEPCRDHSSVIAYMYDSEGLYRVQQANGDTLWRREEEA